MSKKFLDMGAEVYVEADKLITVGFGALLIAPAIRQSVVPAIPWVEISRESRNRHFQ